jgi:hypothetical protein
MAVPSINLCLPKANGFNILFRTIKINLHATPSV